jgi:hypothetical protein
MKTGPALVSARPRFIFRRIKDLIYRQARATIQTIPAQKLALTVIANASPEIAPQFVWRASPSPSSKSLSNQDSRNPASTELRFMPFSNAILLRVKRVLAWGGQLQYFVAHEAPPVFGVANQVPF